ncbi:protein FAR1-RELATED SEQUENCE 6-like [Lotus japonicus]|uniref:protein FAR1-RELATED SEQUENCE 6-like n=1 Tax=Lotus japonicus TaxID=34305 RepID=UPI00258E9E94|nr:protein FAR1-RELATED SEQUENCE 6-like [Lotus japonicus]
MSLPKSYEVDMPQERVEERKSQRQLANVEDRHDVPIAADYTEQFTIDGVFATRDELLDWAKNVGKQLGFVIIIRRSDCGSKGRGSKGRQLAILVCEMSGKFKQYKPVLMRKGTGTKKYDCPFRLKARYTSEDGLWRLTIVRGDHNHAPAETLVGHAYAGRLTSQEKDTVGKMVDNKVKPGNMLLALKDVNPQNLTTIWQVYNERMAHIRAKRGQLSEMQHSMRLLEEDKYTHWSSTEEGSTVIQSLFWAHLVSIQLFNQFSTVVLLDSTYKTNKYRIPLLEMVGMTSVGFTYTIAFGYMCNEREPEVTWALQKLRGLLLREEDMPKVVVTDKDTALMNAVTATFPTAAHLLCQFHIAKCVKAKCKLTIEDKEMWDDVGDAWNRVMYAESAEEFNPSMDFLRSLVGEHSDLMHYIKETWLPFKHKFVKYAIDRYMHMGNTTTNRVEGAHTKLKVCIKDSKSDMCAAWAAIHRCTLLQHTRINAAFQASIFIREHTFKEKLYDNMRGVVSRYALMLITKEKARVGKCGCTMRRTHGLPCSCQIGRMATIPLTTVDQHWRRLTSTSAPDESQPVLGLSIATELEVIVKMFEEANVPRRQAIKERLREISFPDQTSMCPPPNKLPTRGRPNESKGSTRRIPSSWENTDAIAGSKQASNSSAPQGKGRKTRSAKRKSIPLKQSAPKKRSKRIARNSAKLPPQHPKGKVYSANYIHEVSEFLREYIIDI